jgi:hypothetical protein
MSRESETDAKRVVAVVMRAVGEKLGTPRQLRGLRTSARQLSSSISKGERSMISALGIWASSALAIRASIVRSERC